MVRKASLALAVSVVIAVASGLWLPRATSNASTPEGEVSDPIWVRTAVTAAVTAPAGLTRICPIDWRRSTWHVKQLIRCAAAEYGVDQHKALSIAWRESRYFTNAYNATGRAAGVYQHLLKYWPERAADFGFADVSAFNARANILVTMQMVRRYGWYPWGG
jgi:soluble lytic murein transglycosylase-like protein